MKKILFTLLCVLSFVGIVCASDISGLKEQWELSLDNYNETFSFDDRYIYYTYENQLTSIDKNTGIEKTIDLGDNIHSILKKDNYIYASTSTELFKISVDLDIIKSKKLGMYEDDFGDIFLYQNEIYAGYDYKLNFYSISDDLDISSFFKFDDGSFIVVNKSQINLLDKNEKIIRTFTEIDGYYIKGCIYFNGHYYVLSSTYAYDYPSIYTSAAVKLRKLDNNFDIVLEKDIEKQTGFINSLFVYQNKIVANNCSVDSYYIDENDLNVTKTTYVSKKIDNPIMLYKRNYYYFDDIDFYIENVPFSYDEKKEVIDLLNFPDLMVDDFWQNKNGEYLVSGHIIVNEKIIYVVILIDSQGTIKFFETIEDVDSLNASATFFEDFIAVYLEKGQNGIVIYNRDGNIVNTIITDKFDAEDYYVTLYGQENGLTLLYAEEFNPYSKMAKSSNTNMYDEKAKATIVYYKNKLIHYNYDPIVETSSVGEGTVELETTDYKVGDVVSFKYTASNGYVLDKIVVKDEYGNELEVQGNKFVMPSADVKVEVFFKESVINPNTSVFFRVGIACIIAFVCYFFIILKNMKVKQYE